MTKCPACLTPFGSGDYQALAGHLIELASQSDPSHVRWLNQNLSRKRVGVAELTHSLQSYFDLGSHSLRDWIVHRFVLKFFGKVPHPFVTALQHPSREVLLGYVVEHQHFLRQWVRSCSYIMARTDQPEVILYELDNLNTEFGGFGPSRVSHYELLLRMGESLGIPRARVLATPPLPATQRGIEGWERIARSEPWVAAVAAMHSLELIANKNLVSEGATLHYFDPSILDGSAITDASKNFLREGYEADVEHSNQALDLVVRFGSARPMAEEVQSVFLHSIDLFDDYLIARLERGGSIEA
ncbi:MAG: C2H2 type zinc finger domain-containing protein [Thermoplasmata archaeon]